MPGIALQAVPTALPSETPSVTNSIGKDMFGEATRDDSRSQCANSVGLWAKSNLFHGLPRNIKIPFIKIQGDMCMLRGFTTQCGKSMALKAVQNILSHQHACPIPHLQTRSLPACQRPEVAAQLFPNLPIAARPNLSHCDAFQHF